MTKHAIDQALKKYNVILTIDDIQTILDNILNGNSKMLKQINRKGEIVTQPRNYCNAFRITYNGVVMDLIMQKQPWREPVLITFYEPPTTNMLLIKNYNNKGGTK